MNFFQLKIHFVDGRLTGFPTAYYLSVRNEFMCRVTKAALTRNKILSHVADMKKIAEVIIVIHKIVMLQIFTLREIALCSI